MDRRNFFKNSLIGAGSLILAPEYLTSCGSTDTRQESFRLFGRARRNMYFDEKTGMTYRRLGKTGLMVSEIGLGTEWLERHTAEECREVIKYCETRGINILDIWMSEPNVRTNVGNAIKGSRKKWYIQGHLGSTWQNGQYERTRETDKVDAALDDLLTRLQTDYIDLGMMHIVDTVEEWNAITEGEFYRHVLQLKKSGKIRHIGMSTHNVNVARLAAESGLVEMIMFSLNPAYDMLPADADIWGEDFSNATGGINPERAALYNICEANNVGITVMKGYAGGRLFNPKLSPFGVELTPVQCLHYALTRPAVGSVLVGCDTVDHVKAAVAYEKATDDEKDYATVLANAPAHAYGHQCTYCGHCKPCSQGIDIAMVNKLNDLADMNSTNIPSSVLDHYKQLKLHASDCSECGNCELRCPFSVNVIQKMRRAKELFGY